MPEAKDDLKREKVRIVPISNIEDFPDHPFQVKDDESMDQLVESIRMNGVLNPVIALKIDENHYQLISGHRRKHACMLLGIDRIPLIGREMTKEEAVIEMVDSNLQREHILPSEKAKAYKMKMDAMKNQGKRSDLTCPPTKLSEKLKLNEYKRAQLEADLRTAGMDITPELYVSNAIVKAVAIGLLAIPAFLIFKLLGLFIAFVAVVIYFSEYKKVTKMIAAKRKKIEYELPRLVGSIEKTIKHKKGAVYALEAFKDTTCPELKEELEITIADMRSGNEEVALTRLESRVGSTMMSDVTRGLIGVVRGDDMEVYWGTTALKFADYQREQLKAQANAVPRKVRKLSMALLFCFILIYV